VRARRAGLDVGALIGGGAGGVKNMMQK